MGSPVVIALYRALLLSTQQLQRDVDAGRTLYNAIRSGAVASYAGVKSDWQRERMFAHRFDDIQAVQRWQRGREFAALVRSGFMKPVDAADKAALNRRIDAAFEALKGVDNQNALVQGFVDNGSFEPKVMIVAMQERTNAIEFLVGDVVEVQGEKRGVIFGWYATSNSVDASAGPRVVYDILPHSPGFSSFASKLYNVPQDEIRLDEAPKAVIHPALLLYFDGFDGTHHVASDALAARYPSDVARKPDTAGAVVDTPSIIQLQSADEDQLLTYLRCNDSTIVQFAMASLEGKWLGECGEQAQVDVQRALELTARGDWTEARELLEKVVDAFPDYAYAWDKLGMVEYQSGDAKRALDCYEAAVKGKPQFIEALVGLGTCATKLQRWSLAHRAGVQLLAVQPGNGTARMLVEQAIYATL
ncbi:hypothetical protein BBJ28_00005219 [Nothophytophthora sp. Chile5]|nr:hypothetical protein BBJ28_00005219 [Nothophytophthora sp. Chile5]